MNRFTDYRRKVEKPLIASRHLGENRALRIFLPPGYDGGSPRPIVYCQDGEQFFNFGRIATAAERLAFEEGRLAPLIVGIDVDVRKRTEEYAPGGSRFADYCRFVAEELLPWVEAKYGAAPSPEERIVAGDSLGATVSLHLALDYPHLWRRVIAFSGAFLPESQERVERERRLDGLMVYQLVGIRETEVKTERGTFDFLALNRTMARLLKERGAELRYAEEEGDHLWGFWQAWMGDALRRMLP
jgi:enterochelin esterase-like enzyme